MLNGIPNLQNSMNIESAQFLPASATARKKRQISNGLVKTRRKYRTFFLF